MRILGFSQKWQKLSNPEFSTFRFPRRDRDWQEGEVVQIVYKPRSRNRKVLGIAQIMSKECREMYMFTIHRDSEAINDGFSSWHEMLIWINETHGDRWKYEPMNKLTLRWE